MHGNPILNLEGNVQPIASRQLSMAKEGETFILRRVFDHQELLQYLDARDIRLGTELKVIEKNEFADSLVVEINQQPLEMSLTIANMLFTF